MSQIQSLELRLQTQSRAQETGRMDVEALKEDLTKLQAQLEHSQSCLDIAQQQSRRYVGMLESSQKSLRCSCVGINSATSPDNMELMLLLMSLFSCSSLMYLNLK